MTLQVGGGAPEKVCFARPSRQRSIFIALPPRIGMIVLPAVFTLLHTNDFHNHLRDAQAGSLRARRQAVGAAGLLLDAGDAVASGNITFRAEGEPILDTMTQIGYDAMTVGNREFHFSRAGFEAKLSRAGFPVLCGNVRAAGTLPFAETASPGFTPGQAKKKKLASAPTELPVRPYALWETGGWRVVAFGLTVPMITERMLARRVSAYVFDDPLATARRLVPALRECFAPDLLIALTHIGIKQDRALAEAVPGIDLIVGGHTHETLPDGERNGATLIVQTGAFGHSLGVVEIERTGEQARDLRMIARLEPL